MTEQEEKALRCAITQNAIRVNAALIACNISLDKVTLGGLKLLAAQVEFCFENNVSWGNVEQIVDKMIAASKLELDFIIQDMKK